MLVFAILLIVIAVVAFIAGSSVVRSMRAKAKTTTDSYDKRTYEKAADAASRVRWIVTIGAIAILGITMLFSGVRIIDQTEIGVVKTFGQISRNIDGGLNFVNPLTDSVVMVDLKVHKQERTFASYTKDAQPVTASVEFQTETVASRASEIVANYGSQEAMEEKLGNLVEERAKIVLAKYSAMPLLENRANLSAEVTAEVEKLEEQFPVNFTTVIVRDIDFSDAFEASVEAKMTAEQAALKAEQDKKTAIIKAEQEAEVAAIEAEAAIVKARGEAEALEITRQALQNMPDTWIQQLWIEKWNGVLPTTQAGSDAAIIVNPNMGN